MHRRFRRAVATTGAGVLLVAGSTGTAYADWVTNDLDAVVDASVETLSLTAGASATVKLRVENQNLQSGDTLNACNLQGASFLVVDVASSVPGTATVTPAQARIDDCGAASAVSLTVTGVAAGTSTVTVSRGSGTSAGGTFDFAPATFTVDVSAALPTNTPPSVVVDGVTEGASYEKGSVPSATCQVTDAEDGDSSFPASLAGALDADGLGRQTASCAWSDSGGLEATAASATYSVVDPSAPTIGYTLDPVAPDGADGWYTGTVRLTWQVAEPQSPASLATTGCVDLVIDADQLSTTYTCSATSSGGPAGPVEVDLKRDGHGPTVGQGGLDGTEGDDGWYVSPVTASFTATDGFSGVAGPTTRGVTSTTDGAAVVLDSPAFTDNAGNTTAPGDARSPELRIDTVAPSVGDAVLSGTSGANGWWTSAVTASFTASDATSGVSGVNPRTVSTGAAQGSVVLDSPAFRDVAGNVTPAGARSATVMVDSEAPTVGLAGGPASGGSYWFGSVPARPTCTADDSTSGLEGACVVSGYGTAVGSHTVTATALDRAGNETTVTSTYEVKAWTANGYHKPVDMGGVWNTVKNGSTVPLKFEVFAGSEITSTTTLGASFTVRGVKCPGANAATDDVEMTTTGGTSLRYDTTGGQFVQNWQTPKKAGACYAVTTSMADGSSITAHFRHRWGGGGGGGRARGPPPSARLRPNLFVQWDRHAG